MTIVINKTKPEYNTSTTRTSVPISPHPYIGFVKRNDDPQHMGRISVYIPEIGGDPVKESSWVICGYMSHYGGSTDITKIQNYQTNPNVAQQSYGFIGVPPDLNVEVVVIFINGDVSRAYWIGCTFQQNMSQMIPGIGSSPTIGGGSGPSLEYNKGKTTGSTSNPSRSAFAPLSNGLNTQGTKSDIERGSSTTSMQRESPPKMLGYLSPRGNSMHIDDDPGNEFVRFRTRSGTQVLINETTGFVYINSKTGNSWIEVADTGITIYSHDHISLRTQGDFNVHADKNINLDAGGNISMRAGGNIVFDAGGTGKFRTDGDLTLDSNGNIAIRASGTWGRQGSGMMSDYHPGGIISTNSVGLSPVSKLTGTSAPDATQSGNGWSNGGTVNTITSKTPSHEPYQAHPKLSVPKKPAVAAKPAYGKAHGAKAGDSTSASQIDSQQGNFGA